MKRYFILALIGLALLNGCASMQTQPQATPTSPAPTQVTLSSAAKNGELVFMSAGCAGCHSTGSNQMVGPGLAGFMAGRGRYGDKLPDGTPLTDANLIRWIRNGNSINGGLMPGNPALSEQNLSDLIAYLRTLE